MSLLIRKKCVQLAKFFYCDVLKFPHRALGSLIDVPGYVYTHEVARNLIYEKPENSSSYFFQVPVANKKRSAKTK